MTEWITAFFICISMLTFILSIFTMVSIYKLGFNGYLKQFRSLYKFQIDKAYTYEQFVTATWGTHKTKIVNKYYLFVDVKNDKEVTVIRCMDDFFCFPNIEYISFNGTNWQNSSFKIETPCIILHLMKDSLAKKMSKYKIDSAKVIYNIDPTDDIVNDFINGEVVKITRDKKLSKLV